MTDQSQAVERTGCRSSLRNHLQALPREHISSTLLSVAWISMILFWLVQALGVWAAAIGVVGFMYLGAPLVLVSLWLERSWPRVALALPVLGLYLYFWAWRAGWA